jgi:hypothetical protein
MDGLVGMVLRVAAGRPPATIDIAITPRCSAGLTEAIAPAHGDNAKDAYRQVGEANLELKGITGRPADGLGDRVRNEEVPEESTNSASCDTDPKQIQQEDFQPAISRGRLLLSRPR